MASGSKLFGLNRHQLFPYVGMAASRRLQRRDAELLKEVLNCNMVRCSHYPPSPHFLDACDELGLMVWEEPPGWQYIGGSSFQEIVVDNVADMVNRDRNRPSVILWATRLNESDSDNALYARTRQVVQECDGSRQTTGAMKTRSTLDWDEDVFAYDDYSLRGGAVPLQPPIGGVPYIVSEAVGALDGPPLYRWVDSSSTLAAQAELHARVHNVARSDRHYAGLLGWAGIDYGSLSGGDRVWHNTKWPGVLDVFRVPKPGAAFYRSQLDPNVTPIILSVFFWDFRTVDGQDGPGARAMIATNCDFLEFSIDDQAPFRGYPDHQRYGHLAYPPVFVDLTPADAARSPELVIDGYLDTRRVHSIRMAADRSGDRLELTTEDQTIEADGSDMTRFTFTAVDAYGNQRPYVGGEVRLTVSGAALAVPETFAFETYGGVGGGFVRSLPDRIGLVQLTAEHPTLGKANAVEVVPSSRNWR